jgi:two-component system LytT family response regulator
MNAFFIRSEHRFQRIDVQTIQYVEASRNYCKIYTADHMYLVHVALKHLVAALPQEEFCQIHRSFVVAVSEIRSFDNHTVYLSERYLPIGESYLQDLMDKVTVLTNSSYAYGRKEAELV